MTIGEAIRHCEEVAAGETEQGKCPECAAEHKQLAEWLRELVALRAQQTPLDRSRWTGCKSCKGKDSFAARYGLYYCPACGKPMNEDMWAELERRINGAGTGCLRRIAGYYNRAAQVGT